MVLLDIQMPDDCFCCPLFNETYLFCVVGSQGCIDRYGYDSNEKPDWCPIVEKNEDLINAKDVFQIIESVAKEQFTSNSSYEDVLRALLEVNSRVFDHWIFSKSDPYEGD